MLLDDALHDREAEPGAAAPPREERLEHASEIVGFESGPLVFDHTHEPGALSLDDVDDITEACQDPEAKARFLQEARMAGNIEHENIIRIHDYGEEQDRPSQHRQSERPQGARRHQHHRAL